MARITQEELFEKQAEKLFRNFAQMVEHSPVSHTFLLTALQFALGPTKEIVIAGKRGAADTEAMLDEVQQAFLPDAVLLFRPEGEEQDQVTRAIPLFRAK